MSYAEKRDSKLTGRWWAEVDHRHKGSIRFRRAFDSKREADKYETYVRLHGEEPPGLTGTVSGRTFATVAAECKEAGGKRGAWKRGRDKSVTQRLDYICGTKLGKLPIEQVSYGSTLELVADLEKRPGVAGAKLTVGTINRYITAVSAVLTFAVAQHYIERKPELPWRKEAKQGRFHWLQMGREDVLAAALRSAGQDAMAFCVLALVATGMRWGEFAGLEPGQIDDRGAIRLWETKTDVPRTVYVRPELARELRAFVAAGRIPKYITFAKRFARAVKSCGENPALTLHCLRHTACTRLVMAKWPLPKVQRFMGHKSIETTMRYFHMLEDEMLDAAEILSPNRGETALGADVIEFPAAKKA